MVREKVKNILLALNEMIPGVCSHAPTTQCERKQFHLHGLYAKMHGEKGHPHPYTPDYLHVLNMMQVLHTERLAYEM